MSGIIAVIGGIGVFLLGMVIMTDGLKQLAGARLHRWLAEATQSPWSGAFTGAISTAILQSSSAMTVAAVGFVGAGLLTFPQALGIIFGANIGTTLTGWLVALLGFKLQLGELLMPLIFVGVLMRIFSTKRIAHAGYAAAGFALIFLGIDLLQAAASGYADLINLDFLPPDSWHSRLKLVFFGAVITLLTQSSSAGVAAALVAIHTGAINFEQGASLVIGMDVGTTVTAALATIGGSVETRRTGFSHVIYNFLTATGALLLISPFVFIWQAVIHSSVLNNPEIALVAFHTTFNVLGALIVLPFTKQFASMMTALIKEDKPQYTRVLDESLLKEPSVALLAAHKIIIKEFLRLLVNINLILERQQEVIGLDMSRLKTILEEARDYLDRISIGNQDSPEARRLVALIHAMDHMQRLHERCDEDLERAVIAGRRSELSETAGKLDDKIDEIVMALEANEMEKAQEISQETYRYISELENPTRELIYQQVVREDIDIRYATESAEALRWLTRVSRHLSRICYYLNASQSK